MSRNYSEYEQSRPSNTQRPTSQSIDAESIQEQKENDEILNDLNKAIGGL